MHRTNCLDLIIFTLDLRYSHGTDYSLGSLFRCNLINAKDAYQKNHCINQRIYGYFFMDRNLRPSLKVGVSTEHLPSNLLNSNSNASSLSFSSSFKGSLRA
mmetsp:Transcript_41971/g.50359  ORF Transcript_41971/g.50359 Transcript_41971/m.50359 type:complete len:101 (-) Transcript_41971:1112-1414(-)